MEVTSLTTIEQSELESYEVTIQLRLHSFVADVGSALLAIRDDRLYRQQYPTFEDYCRERWGMVSRHVNRLIAAAKVVSHLGPMGLSLPITERQVRPLTVLSPDQQREAWTVALETAPNGKMTAAHVESTVQKITKPQNIHVSDDTYEWFTPAEYIEAAKLVMGGIDLDPASCLEANRVIKAKRFYTREDDGLTKKWSGRIWLNPPYNMPWIERFVNRIVDEYEEGNIDSAIVLTNNSTDTGWFHRLFVYPVCFTSGRIQFWNGSQRLATRQGQALFYLGPDTDKFNDAFQKFGVVMVRYDHQ